MSVDAVPFPEHPFWGFSLAVYGSEGVAPACLALQDRRGIDVNLLLFCLWSATERRLAYDVGAFRAIAAAAGDWQLSVVAPMRAARRRLKAGSPYLPETTSAALRREVLAAEIGCEHGEQLIIAAVAEGLAGAARAMEPAAAAAANVRACCEAAGIRLEASDVPALSAVLGARLPEEAARSAAAAAMSGGG